MGRRALRKIDPALDLSSYLTTVDALAVSRDLAALFKHAAPLQVEVGTGKGLFLRTAAAATAEHNFLGIEIAHRYAEYAAAGLAAQHLTNACVVSGDAVRLFRELLPESSLAAVHVYFPDPWWKARHRKRRVMNAAFVADIERTLQPAGRLHFWTDVEEYFQTTVTLLRDTTKLQGPAPVPEAPPAHDLDYRTHFERRMRMHHAAIYRAEFLKSH